MYATFGAARIDFEVGIESMSCMGKDASPIRVGSFTFVRTLQHTAATYNSRTMDTFIGESCAKALHMYAVHLTVHDDPAWRYKNALQRNNLFHNQGGKLNSAFITRMLVSATPLITGASVPG